MRCSRRSAPLRSTLQVTPGYLASNDLPICSDSLRSIEVYQTTLPSFLAASISAVMPALIEAAKKEGKVVGYTSIDLKLSEQIGKAFETKYPGVSCKVERSGAERLLQRISQEYSANVHAVDVVNSSDASLLVYWKEQGMLAPYVPEDVAKFYPPQHQDVDGNFASFRIFLCVIAYNTNLVKKDEAPKSFADLLLPQWKGKIVKAHPGYSGTILTATYQCSRDLGWGYFEKLAQQNVLLSLIHI